MPVNQLLSLSQAARLVGVDRRTLQEQIRRGGLETFEGHIRLGDLQHVYPHAEMRDSGMLEKVRRIQECAMAKASPDSLPSREALAGQLHRLHLSLAEQQLELDAYRQLTGELQERLTRLQKNCDRKQKIMLQAVLAWFSHELKRHSRQG